MNMNMKMNMKVGCLIVLLVCAMLTVGECSVSCGTVSKKLSSCIPYLRGKAGSVPGGCCSGMKALNSAAKTTRDRQDTCKCLKSAASEISGLSASRAAGLPAKCGVKIPYKISTSTNCNSVK